MAFDKETRNLLAKTVVACRHRLTEDVTDQLRGVFGLHPDGTVLPLGKMTHLTPDQTAAARHLRDLLDHYISGAAGMEKDRQRASYERMVLEISFTILNRLAALRLCEERGLVVECVRKGTASDGIRLFERVSGGELGGRYETYRVFLECLFDELALDLGVLFDRLTPQSAIFPTERCLEDVLAELNKSDLAQLWTEDETIGWIYQYFNPKEERDAMRKASRSPRNTRELAVRNQFFTPRYVVEFLTDNTLGRIWYEMCKGDTVLIEECRYIVRRPKEVFLSPGENPPANREIETNDSPEELLNKTIYTEHRPKKDPRDIKVLDPACGSGHFLLYAFHLFEQIYEEAWQDKDSPKSASTGRTLRDDYGSINALRRAVPELILHWNLHGIDIDPRSVQIAALALWLRAQRSWKNQGLRATERPPITRCNIVTAEPMPGEEDMRREFSTNLKPHVLGQLVNVVFEKMKLAGEAGSLLKIEEEIKDVVTEASRQWLQGPQPEQLLLFPERTPKHPKQLEMRFDVGGVTDERFWEQAEERIHASLKHYAERVENGGSARRRLFTEDTARGFSFIDLCRKRYDVVLMNPPFGEMTENSRPYIESSFPFSRGNILAHFLERAATWTHAHGKTGAIVSRTCFFLTTLDAFRSSVLAKQLHVETFADLGSGVLDAMVETAAAIFNRSRSHNGQAIFIRMLTNSQKESELLSCIDNTYGAVSSQNVFLSSPTDFEKLNGSPYVYWITPRLISQIASHPTLEPEGCEIRVGLQTGDDNRFLRLWYEIPQEEIISAPNVPEIKLLQELCLQQSNEGKVWAWYSKIDSASPLAASIHLVVNWSRNGKEIKAYHEGRGYSASKYVMSESHYFRPGISYMLRSARLVPYLVPRGVIPTAGRSQIYPKEGKEQWILALAASNVASIVARFRGENFGRPVFQNSMVASVPYVEVPEDFDVVFAQQLKELMRNQRSVFEVDETCIEFIAVPRNLAFASVNRLDRSSLIGRALDLEVGAAFGFNEPDMEVLERDLMDSVKSPAWVAEAREESETAEESVKQQTQNDHFHFIISYALGCAFGRWDIRLVFDPSMVPNQSDPFDVLPVCSPGMLVGPNGLLAEPISIVNKEWLRAQPTANVLPPSCLVRNAIIPDAEYPLRISWDGILVDDPGWNSGQPHRDDIVRCVQEVLDLIWKEKAHEIELEACCILGVSDLHDYFRRPIGFFQDHLKRYSKSRRKAPIYWPLSTTSGSYTVWLYYHRLSDQTLYAVVNKFVEPKISEVERGLARIEEELLSASASDATRLRDGLNDGRTFLGELRDFREELLRIAALPYKPNLNDGVIINAAPLHKLFRLRQWGKDTEDCWKKLAKGEYDWAHLAYTIWPDRVRDICKKDRSIAIAHGLEDLCETEAPTKKKGGRGRKK